MAAQKRTRRKRRYVDFDKPEIELVEKAIAKSGKSASQWMRDTLLGAALAGDDGIPLHIIPELSRLLDRATKRLDTQTPAVKAFRKAEQWQKNHVHPAIRENVDPMGQPKKRGLSELFAKISDGT